MARGRRGEKKAHHHHVNFVCTAHYSPNEAFPEPKRTKKVSRNEMEWLCYGWETGKKYHQHLTCTVFEFLSLFSFHTLLPQDPMCGWGGTR
jgi:hypothetical protein